MKKTFLVGLFILGWVPTVFACNTFLVLGDSLSSAYGIDPSKGWVTLLQNKLKLTNPKINIINASVSGDTTLDGKLKLSALINKHHPCSVIVELGGNDGLRGIAIEQIKANLRSIIRQLKAKKISILLIGVSIPPNYGPDYTRQFTAIYKDLAKEYGISLVPQLLKHVGDKAELMQSDGIHPTAEGQKIMLDNVVKEIDFH